jgi:hypothetical protein
VNVPVAKLKPLSNDKANQVTLYQTVNTNAYGVSQISYRISDVAFSHSLPVLTMYTDRQTDRHTHKERRQKVGILFQNLILRQLIVSLRLGRTFIV